MTPRSLDNLDANFCTDTDNALQHESSVTVPGAGERPGSVSLNSLLVGTPEGKNQQTPTDFVYGSGP